MHTRAEYMQNKCTHREYYAQFVDDRTKAHLLSRISADRIKKSTCPNFSDIPLKEWDAITTNAPGSGKFTKAADYYTLAGGVCMLKEAARQIREAATHPQEPQP